ncbi:hypothetical protein Tco_1100763 [Tanacetum coccineum]
MKSVYLRNEEDKRRGVKYVMNTILGFYKECLELGPEYLTRLEDEGGVTMMVLTAAAWSNNLDGTQVFVDRFIATKFQHQGDLKQSNNKKKEQQIEKVFLNIRFEIEVCYGISTTKVKREDVTKMILFATYYVWWHGMKQDVEDFIVLKKFQQVQRKSQVKGKIVSFMEDQI